jgi:GT2 family glycosyltransferase
VVPTLDGGERWRQCLAALAAQRPKPAALVVVDSGSSDGSAEAAERAGACVLRIGQSEFDHGETRNRGADALPPCDAVIFLVQDAVPKGEACLATLAAAALRPGTGAASARQVPPVEAGWLTASTVEGSPFAASTPRRTGPLEPQLRSRLTPERWRPLLLLDDVACAVRAALFRRVRFRRTSHGEDALLAYDLLCGGWALEHEPAAVVEHGHAYDEQSVRRRYREDAAFFRQSFGLRVRSGPLDVLKGLRAELRRDRRWLLAHGNVERWGVPADRRAAWRLRWAQVQAQRDGSRGPLGRLPESRAVPTPAELGA